MTPVLRSRLALLKSLPRLCCVAYTNVFGSLSPVSLHRLTNVSTSEKKQRSNEQQPSMVTITTWVMAMEHQLLALLVAAKGSMTDVPLVVPPPI